MKLALPALARPALALLLAGSAILPVPAIAQAATRDADAEAQAYLDRIAELDDAGPAINAVIAVNPAAPQEAAKAQAAGLPLAGRTVLVKDNIETSEWPTTAGSLALKDNMTGRDAPLIANLRKAGGVVLGKTNLSEWANFRDGNSISGWSGVGGLTRNPHATDRSACGSSAGSGAAVAAGFAWAAIGTETDGSIVCPSSMNGIVGFKPTLGMVSRTYVVPISASQDTAGPMARSVYDAALLLGAIAGSDPADPATAQADAHKTDFTAGLANASLKGVRIGVLRKRVGPRKDVSALFDHALDDMRAAGAVLVDIDYTPPDAMNRDEYTVLLYEFREGVDAYLAGLPEQEEPRTLEDLIAFNDAHADSELRWFGQSIFKEAAKATDREAYLKARANYRRLAREEGIDKLLKDNNVEVLIAPTNNPAWTIDMVNGDHYTGGVGATGLAAIAGYPDLTVPMGAVEGMPIGLSFVGGQWSDHRVLQIGAAYEKARTARLATPRMGPWKPVEADPAE